MRLSVDLKSSALATLRKRARAKGYKSAAEFVRRLIADECGLDDLSRSWGGARQVKHLEPAVKTVGTLIPSPVREDWRTITMNVYDALDELHYEDITE